jgi:hypothetical protein
MESPGPYTGNVLDGSPWLKSDEVSVKAAKGRQRDHHVIGKRVGAKTSDAFTDAVLDGLCPAVTFISIDSRFLEMVMLGLGWVGLGWVWFLKFLYCKYSQTWWQRMFW